MTTCSCCGLCLLLAQISKLRGALCPRSQSQCYATMNDCCSCSCTDGCKQIASWMLLGHSLCGDVLLSSAFGAAWNRVRANEAHAYSHTSPLACRYVMPAIFLYIVFMLRGFHTGGYHTALIVTGDVRCQCLCRPEDSVQSCVKDTHQLMALKGSTPGATALLEAVQLTSTQAATAHKLILCGSLLQRELDVLLLRLTRASLASQESSMKVRACAWRALAEVLAVKPEILAVPVAQEALKSALSEKEKSAQVRSTGDAVMRLLHCKPASIAASSHVQVQDKALDVLANHIRGDPAACRMHLPMIQQATRHHFPSVRKRAVDIIWDCYISDETFSAANRALCNKLLLFQLQMFEGLHRHSPFCSKILTLCRHLLNCVLTSQIKRPVCVQSCWRRSSSDGSYVTMRKQLRCQLPSSA